MNQAWLPKSVLLIRQYSRDAFIADLLAGLTVGLVALPLAMAFAISSGLSPQSGIYTAIVAGFMISALGGSRVQIGGVTGLGSAVKFIPRPVVIGFTNGIAVLIASTQIRDFLGLDVPHPSGVFVPRLIEIGHALGTISP